MIDGISISIDGRTLKSTAIDRLQSVSISDEAGETSDTISMVFNNYDSAILLPDTGAEITAVYKHNNENIHMGLFTVNKITPSISDQGDKVTIEARGADMRASLKVQKTRSFSQVSIGNLVRKIAAEHGLDPAVAPEFDDIYLAQVNQTAQSDLHLLRNIAKNHGSISKPIAGRLLFTGQGESKSFGGVKLPNVVLDRNKGDIISASAIIEDRKLYGSCQARWHDEMDGMDKIEKFGSGHPVYTIKRSFPTQQEALAGSKAKLEALNRGNKTLRLQIPGNPLVGAEVDLTILNCGDGINGDWVAAKVVHSYSNSGNTTSIDGHLPKS